MQEVSQLPKQYGKEGEELLKEFRREFKNFSDKHAIHLIIGLYDAKSVQEQYEEQVMIPKNTTMTKLKRNFEALEAALIKLYEKRGTEEAAVKSIKKHFEAIPKTAYGQIDIFFDNELSINKSAFEHHISHIIYYGQQSNNIEYVISCLELVLQDFITNGKGSANRRAKYYAEGIRVLSEHFTEITRYRASSSSSEETYFYKYVLFWLNRFMQFECENPSRHIEYALGKFF